MISCVTEKSSLFGRDLEQFEEIQNHFGWSEGVTRTKIGTWQTKNKTDEFPTIEEMRQYEKYANSILLDDSERQQEEEYNKLLSELRLSREKTDIFIINFMRNTLNTNPRYKIDETASDFVYNSVLFDSSKTYDITKLDSLLHRIFGYTPKFFSEISVIETRENILQKLSEELDNWEDNLLDILANPINLNNFYTDINHIKERIKILQNYLSRGLNSEDFSEHELQVLKSINLKESHTKRQVGFKLQQLKSELKNAELNLQKAKYRRYSILLSAKNRLVALDVISNLKDLVKDRISRELDSRTVKESTYKQKVLPNIRLAKSIKNVLEFGSRTDKSFINKKEKEEISYDELINNIVSKHPEYRYLIKLFKEANPKLKIIIGGEAEYHGNGGLEGIVPGKFSPGYNTLYLTNSADIYTVIHELAHSATYYGLIGREKEENKIVQESINKFMDYIRDYIKDNQLNPSLFTEIYSDLFHFSFKPSIYGFTNASEFIAELFGNPRFRDMLELIPPMEQKKFNSLLQEIWHTIIDALQRIFGKKTDSNALQQAEKLGYTALLLQQNHLESIYEMLDKYTHEAQNNVINGYTPEMQQIKNQAIANGTFMKAPNGKPTNLDERQWLVVRTKAFKDWFGDWETLAESHINTLEIINEDGSVNFDKLEELTDEYFKNADESLFAKGRKTLKERKEHHNGETNTLEHLQNVVKSAKNSNISDNLKPHVIIAAALHDIAKPFHGGNKHGFQSEALLDKIFKGRVSGLAKFAIAHHMMTIEEGETFTRTDAERIVNDAIKRNLDINEAIDVLIALHIADITRGRNLEDIDEYSNKTIREVINTEVESKRTLLRTVAGEKQGLSVSKVIDENGEPLVVYHGSDKQFTTFDVNSKNRGSLTSIIKKGFYFSNKNIASQYASSKLRNDYFKLQELREGGFSFEEIAEAFGANRYNDDSMDKVAEYIMSLEKETIDFQDNLYAVFLNIKQPIKYDLKGKTISSLSKSQKEAINNSEGAIINNVDETTAKYRGEITIPGMYVGTDYIVFDPNQIKSATDNTKFSRENNNIYRGRTIIDAAADIKAQELSELQSEIDFYKARLNQFKDSKYKQDFINKQVSFYIDIIDKFKSRIKNTTARTISAVEEILDTAKIYGDIIKPLRSVGYYTSNDSDGRIQYHPEKISPVINMQGIKKRAAQDLKSNITTLTRTVKNLEEKYKQVERKDLQTIIDENNITDTSIFQGTASLNKNSITEYKKLEIAEKGVKFDSDYQAEVIKHLETDKISYTDLERKELVALAKALFDYFNKNGFKIKIVTRPYSEQEAQVRSSAVSTIGKYATIYYVKQDNQESPFITLLHELLHIATSDAMPFDAMGRAIEDEQLQNYYNIFCSYVSKDPEYRKYNQQLMNAKSPADYYAVPYKYRVLHHATESVGEFFSSFLNEKDVRDTVSSITYGEGRNLLEWLKNKIEEILSKIFKGFSHIQNTEILKDITNFLLNYQYQGESNLRYMDSEYNEYVIERNKENELEFNNALSYKDVTTTKAPNIQTISEEFYTKQAMEDYVNDLIADGIKREDIVINYTPATEDIDDYWTVSYNQPSTQRIPQSYEGLITPNKNTIFVFGSNPEGRHGAGAAKIAREQFGAIYGQGEGLQGNSYAIPTKDLRVKENKSLKSISPEQQLLEQKLDYHKQFLHLVENFGSKNGPIHTIPYREYAKINKVFESFGYVREIPISSYLYKIYGDNLKGIFDYNKETKELTVNNWVYELINLINQYPENICNWLEAVYDGAEEVIVSIENDIQMERKFVNDITNQLSQLKTTTNQLTFQEPTLTEPLFKEESSTSYRERTIKNAKADATIALATDFTSAGERLTRKAVIDNGKKYIPVDTNNPEITDELVNSIVDQLNEVNAKSLNIAGNGIYTLKGKYTQEQIDEYVYNLLNRVLNHPNLQTKIETIRSGGQTGYDEAGIKAAMRLGIRNGILAPKGWKFRDINGRDISDEQAFKARFNIQSQQTQQATITEQPIDTHQEKETVDMTLDRQMKQVWTPTVLNSRIIRVTQIFKDIVTKLENQLDEKEQLATSAATRQYLITTKYGAKNILNKVREEIQKTYADRDWVENFVHELYDKEDWNTQEVIDKIDYIYQQGQYMLQFFEPLIMEASTEIKRLEKVSILTNDGELTQDDFEEDNVKAEEAVLSKHEEGWFIENHEQSVESTLSSEVKTILNNLYEKDSEGFQTRFDDLEQPIPLDYRVALGTCLYVVGNCTSDTEMIPALQDASTKYPWLQDVVNILMGIDTETSKYYEGLSKEDIELKAFNMRSLFWHDMHKVFVNIAEQSTNDKGEITTEIKNKVEGKEALDAEFEDNCYNNKTIFNEKGKPYKMVYNADGSFNKVNYDNIHSEILKSKLYQHISTGKVSEDELDLIERALKSFGANINKDSLNNLFTTGTNTQWSTLHNIIFGFYNAKQASNQPLQSVIGEEKANIYDAFREKYDMLSTLFANTAEGRDESSVYITVDGESKRLFSRIFPNRIHTLFNRLINRDRLSEKDYKARLNEKYGKDWWYAAENPDGETPSFTGVLKDLWTSKKDRQKIKIKTLKASQGISYADEIDAQAEETRLNEFETTKNDGYADYSVPTFSDTGESYYATMKYFDVHNAEQRQELITRLTDVIRQEIRRINVVRERARINKEAIEAGLPKPIQPIACWDIDLDKGEVSTDGTNFHFFPALNKDKEIFLRKFNELSNDPAAQQQLLERAVIYALNEEFKTYLNFYNQTQVNQLPKSKHTETGNKQFIDYIKVTKDSRKDNPLNSAQLTAINVIINKLQNDTLHPDEFASLKEQAKTILTSNITDEQRKNVIEASIDSFQEDVSNLNKLEDYFWNYFYAQTQIINLTIKDPAFLGTADKVQKRYKMYYSPVQTAYTQEYDLDVFSETGELVEIPEKFAKKTEYSLILTDDTIEQVYSFDNLKSLIDKKVEDGYLTKEQAVEILSNLSDIYAKTKGKRAEINLADAQCYRTLPSWQRCLNMIGKGYNKKMQQSINRLMNPDEYGDWSYEDFHNVWEIFKPFVASDMSSPSGVENLGSQYAEISMPVMHKNAEFLLLAMYNQLSGVMKDNWKLKALNEFMVKHGIDKVQFESAVKLGSQGAININNCTTPEEVVSTLEITTGLNGNKQAEEGNKQVVHSIPFEDWGISTSMPEHLLDHPESSMGTQLMKIITEGLSENPNKTLKVGDRTMTYAQWLEEYQALQIANLMDDFAEVGKIFNNNEELVTYLKKQILTQNKYSHELLHHLELDENGNFKYPLIDPMLRNQFDALCSSLIRNNVTKRKRRMGALPQVAAFGFEEELQIRCTDRNGTLLRTKKEFEEQGSNIQGIETWEAYKEYCDHNATNIAYMEVYMPPFDTTLMRKINDVCIYKEDVRDKNGKLIHRSGEFNHQLFNKLFNIDKENPLNNKLKMGLANRVPTETKHSIIPIYVKGFLPAQNSSCVVVPAEWIAISDSDNDGDKLYCYFYHSKAVIGNISQMKKDWASQHNWTYLSKAQRNEMRASASNYRTDNFKKSEELDADWETPEEFSTNKELEEFKKQAFKNPKYVSSIEPIEFKTTKLERLAGEDDITYQHRCEMASIASNSFEARNNRMLDLERAVLQTDENSAQMLIPGGFPIIKDVVKNVIKPLYNATNDLLSICNPATRTIQQIRNMAGANLIGIYANHRSFRPLLERAKCTLHADYQPTINGNKSLPRENGNLTWSLSSSTNAKGEFISDNISNFSGASVDNAKDPLLSWLGQNTITAPLTMFLIHCGYTIKEVALFMNQPIIKQAVKESFITGESLEKIVQSKYLELKKNSTGAANREVASQLLNSTMEDQIRRETKGILPTAEDNLIQMVVLENLMAIMPASRAIQNLINVTKADTQVGALQAKSSENKSKLLLYDKIISEVSNEDYPIMGAEALVPESVSIEDITSNRKSLTTIENATSDKLALTAAFRNLGVESIEDFTKDISMTFTKLVDKVLDVAMEHYKGLTLNAETIEALTHATTSYIFSGIAALNKGDRLKRFNMALAILREVKKTNLGKDNILIRDLLVNVNGNKYSRNMPFIKLKRLNNNYTATESYRRAWEELIVNGDKTIQLKDRTITYKQLSNLLFNYCFMVSGLTKRGNSFINCFPTAYINQIEGYNELLQRIPNMDITNDIANNIFEQYVANHPEDSKFVHRINKEDFDIKGFLDKSKVVPDVIRINDFTKATGWYDTMTVMGSEVRVPYDFITFTDDTGKRYLYKGFSNETDGIYYQRVSVLGNSRNGYLEEYELGKTIDLINGVQSIIADNMSWFISTNVKTEVEARVQEANIQGRTLSNSEYKELYTRLLGDSSGIKITLNDYTASEEDTTGMKFCAII